MNHKLLILALIGLGAEAQAVTTVQLGAGGGVLTNLQNSTGSATQTLVWGLLVDTDGNGFQGGNYTPGFTISDTATTPNGVFLSTSTGLTGDRLFISTNLMTTGGTTDGSTGLAKPTNINLAYSTDGALGVTPLGGQQFAVIWFDLVTKTGQASTGGSKYGLYTLPFNTPADTLGGSIAFGSNFVGADAVRPASLTLVPEPSSAILGALGVLGLLRRRRN